MRRLDLKKNPAKEGESPSLGSTGRNRMPVKPRYGRRHIGMDMDLFSIHMASRGKLSYQMVAIFLAI
jgi:hypothetical protein